MPYNYDYFISYAHADNKSEDNKSGFVDEFVKELRDSEEQQQMFGRKTEVFFDKSDIQNMSDWDNRIRSSLATSRFLIVLLSPGYFKSEYCAREFDWWMQHEMHRRMLGEGTAPMLIVDVSRMYDYQSATIPDIPADLQARFPNWLNQIRKIQSGPQFDMHDLDRAKISDALDSLRAEVKDKVKRQDAAERSPQTGQYPQYNENFVGRRENLRSLRKSLSEKAAATYSALTGLGGFGKTELALTYGHAFAWDYLLGRVFAKCENKTSLTDILLSCGIAEMNGWELPKGSEEQQITFLFSRLKTKRDEIVQRNAKEGNLLTLGAHILLILDNVNKLELISKKNLAVLPDFFHVIITTRENANEFPHIYSKPVERLSEDESVELLSNLHPFADIDEANAARDIAKLLAGFTLTVELTGAYLNKNKHITYQKQYDRLVNDHAKTIQTIADKTGDLTRHDAQTVAAVLESTLSALSPNARKALDFASVMAPDTVALGWLPELLGLDEDEGWEVHDELIGYSLLTPLENEPNIARMHSLVAETVRQDFSSPDAMGKIFGTIFKKINALFNNDETFWCTPENSWNITPIYEFFMTLADRWKVEAVDNESNRFFAKMLDRSGSILESLGRIKEARTVSQRLIDFCEMRIKSFPENVDAQRDLKGPYHRLGYLDILTGNGCFARSWFEKSLEIDKQLIDGNPDNLQSLNLLLSYFDLGNLESINGNITAAREWNEKALKIELQLFDTMPEKTYLQMLSLRSMLYSQLGLTEQISGNVTEAREWYNKSLKTLEQVNKLLEDVSCQAWLLIIYFRLGDLEKDIGNTDAARKSFEKALEINQRLVKVMPENVMILLFLGILYLYFLDLENSAGNINAARNWSEKALDAYKRLSDIMPDSIYPLCLSYLYKQQGVWEKEAGNANAARTMFEKALENDTHLVDKFSERDDTKHSMSISYINLGILEKDAGNTTIAREWFEKAVGINKPLADTKQEDVVTQQCLDSSYTFLGLLEKDAGNITGAREWFEKALEINKQRINMTPDFVDAQQRLSVSYVNFGLLEKDAGNTTDAREWFKKALEIIKTLADTKQANVTTQQYLSVSYLNFGKLEKDSGNPTGAREWFEKAMEIRQRLADKMPERVTSQRDLSEVYFNLGALEVAVNNPAKAKEWCNKALAILEQVIDKIPHDVESQKILGNIYQCLGDSEKADGNIKTALDWYEKSLNVLQQLANRIPDNVQVQKDLADMQKKLAQVQNQS